MQATSSHFRNRWQESYEEALRVSWDAHHQVLAAAILLEGHIERLGHSISCGWSGNCGQLGSHQCSCSRRCSRSCRRHPPAGDKRAGPFSGRPHWGFCKKVGSLAQSCQAQKMSHLQKAQHKGDTSVWEVSPLTQNEEAFHRSKLAEGDLWPPPSLDPELEYFLGECMPLQGAEEERGPQQDLWPKPSLKDHCKWIEWHGQCVDMPVWWWELQAIPNVEDHQELAQKVRASFKVPMVCS